jgi:uncharacterized protein YuzE
VKIEYDCARDLLYLWLGIPGSKATQTITVAPGVFADLDVANKLIGLEVLDAREILGDTVNFEVALSRVGAGASSAGPD